MATFEYQVLKSDGTTEQGMTVGSSLDNVARALAERGLTVQKLKIATSLGDPLANVPIQAAVRPVETPRAESSNPYDVVSPYELPNANVGPDVDQRSYFATSVAGPIVGKVSLNALAFFFRQAGTMVHAGVPIVQVFNTLTNQAREPKLKKVLKEIGGHVEAGRAISSGMQRYPEVFTPVVLSLVRTGEEGGFLDEALNTVADYLEQELELRNLYKKVTFYPKLQLVASMVIIAGANLIIASVKPGAKGLSSPLTTASTWYVLVPIIVGIFLFLRVGLANPRVKYMWDAFVSHVPYIGNTMRQINMAKFGRAFAALHRSGVPMQRSLVLSADACGNEYLRSRMYRAQRALQEGAGITETLKDTGAFSPIVIDMVSTGETTGSLDQMLNKVADFYIGEAKVRQTQLGYVVGVLVGLLVAVYIGYIVITFYQGYSSDMGKIINN